MYCTVLNDMVHPVHIDPSTIPIEHMSGPTRQLPPGVSAFQVYTDYLQKLHAAAVTRFQTRRGADLFKRLTTQDRVQYILTIPAAWQSEFGDCRLLISADGHRGQSPPLSENSGDARSERDSSRTSSLPHWTFAPSPKLAPWNV
jgi:hypothetical protein